MIRPEVQQLIREMKKEARRSKQVCMNPRTTCSACVFEASRFCLPEEREAKRGSEMKVLVAIA